MIEKFGQMLHGDVDILVDCGRQGCAAMTAIVGRIVSSAAKETHPERCARDYHDTGSRWRAAGARGADGRRLDGVASRAIRARYHSRVWRSPASRLIAG